MKLLTLNTHSLIGEDAEERMAVLVEALASELPDIAALQEVNQSRDAAALSPEQLGNFVSCGAEIPVKADNFVYRIVEALRRRGVSYFWVWLPVKLGYGMYDEGLAFLCRMPIERVEWFPVSACRDYENWKTRMVLLIRPKGSESRFCNLHMSRWDDEEEPFAEQWQRLRNHLWGRGRLYLMGDLNNSADRKNEGYDLVRSQGFYDSYLLAHQKSEEAATVLCGIDGWQDHRSAEPMRIDYIFCNEAIVAGRYRRVFDGKDLPRVSDHCGVILEMKE